MARDFDRQVAEFQLRVAVLNGVTALGIHVTKIVGQLCPGEGLASGPIDLRFRHDSRSARRLIHEQSFLADGRTDGPSSTVLSQSHGKRRVDDRRVLGGIIFINRNGLRWCDAPKDYGPAKTHWKRWGDKGVFTRMREGLASGAAVAKTGMIDATCPKAHRSATSLRAKTAGLTTIEAA